MWSSHPLLSDFLVTSRVCVSELNIPHEATVYKQNICLSHFLMNSPSSPKFYVSFIVMEEETHSGYHVLEGEEFT